MRAFTIGSKGFVIPLAGVEAVKWFGLVCMLQEHVFRYVLHAYPFAVYCIGRMAFPLFAFALALTAPRDRRSLGRVVSRLILWGCVSEVLRVPVLPQGADLNVLFTFALGLMAAHFIMTDWRGLIVGVMCLALSSFVEYGMFGVLFVILMRVHFGTLNGWLLILGAACLAITNNSLVPLAAFVLAPVVASSVTDVPRVKGVFYSLYAAQWPLLWGLRHAF